MKQTLTAFTLLSSCLYANPQGMDVKLGDVITGQTGKTLHVIAGDESIIHWDSFNIDQGETTRFVLPCSSSYVLNRVVGGDMSQIHGSIDSNGQIYIVNPHGIYLGESANINVGTFFATTLDTSDEAMQTGGEITWSGDSNASVVNMGRIRAMDGDVLLIGRFVRNAGSIDAPCGSIGFGAAREVLLKPKSNERIFIKPTQTHERKEEVGVDNSGTLFANNIEMRADGNPYKLAIKDSGESNAFGILEEGGQIYLTAEGGRMDVRGEYTAQRLDGTGGKVVMSSMQTLLLGKAKIDVSGETGGGEVLLGNKDNTIYLADETKILANAKTKGDGGRVIIDADQAALCYGSVEARAGSESGDGGTFELHSNKWEAVTEAVDLTAPNGKDGTQK